MEGRACRDRRLDKHVSTRISLKSIIKNYMNKNILAIDIGGSKLLMGLVSHSGGILYKKKYPISPDTDQNKLMKLINAAYTELTNNVDGLTFDRAGATVPGLADPENGIWVLAPYSGIDNFHIAEELSKLLRVPVSIENDVNACAIAEHAFGECKDSSDFAWITVSNGCGGSIFANGRLYPGGFANAGEVGHIIVEEDNGLKCGCGNSGCFEAMAAGPGIVQRYCNHADLNSDGLLTAKDVANMAMAGDEIAKKVFNKTGYYIGKVMAIVANIVNPQKIVLGGGVSLSMKLFESEMLKTYQKMVFKEANKDLQIIRTGLGQDAALLGAAALVIDKKL